MQTSLKQRPKSKGQRILTRIWQDRVLYLLLAPAMLYFVFFRLWPIWNMRLAFFNYKARSEWTWAGLKWFEIIFSSNGFFTILGNTMRISFMKYVLMFPFSVAFAILLNELRSRVFVRTAQTMMLFPHYISWVVVSYILLAIFSNKNGLANQLLNALGMKSVSWYTKADAWPTILVWMKIWKSAGMNAVIYLAAITGIDITLYEAARVDGASKWRQIWNITMPGLLPTIVLMLILKVGYILETGFEQVLVFYNPAVYEVADIIQTYVYRLGMGQMDFPLSTALGLFNSVVAFVLIVSANAISRKLLGRSIW